MERVRNTDQKLRMALYQAEAQVNPTPSRVRRWTRAVCFALIATILAAIWQDRALAPLVHDGMTRLAILTAESTKSARQTVRQALHVPSGSGSVPEFGGLTRWLLDNRN